MTNLVIFRSNQVIFITHPVIFRTNPVMYRTIPFIFRTNPGKFKTNEVIFRTSPFPILILFQTTKIDNQLFKFCTRPPKVETFIYKKY